MVSSDEIKTFNKLYTDYHAMFLRFANSYIQDKAAAEDIVTDSIVYYWECRHTLQPNSNVPAYIIQTIKHKILNHLRHQKIQKEVEQKLYEHHVRVNELRIMTLEACNPEELFSQEVQQLIDEALEELPEKTRQIFIMSRYENQSYSEIATFFAISVKSVEFHISKALKILRHKLKDYSPILFFFI